MTSQLHPYQEDCVDAIIERGSMLVAYDMGLGKTVLTLAAIEEWLGSGEITQALIIVPASLVYQWAAEIARHTDVATTVRTITVAGVRQELTVPTAQHCVIVEGPPAARAAAWEAARTTRADYVIATYNSVVSDWKQVRRARADAVVLDEATAIKGFKAQRTRRIKRISAPRRIALTGTPVENGKPEEVFSIMEWVDPTVLGRADLFDRAYVVRNSFGGAVRYKNLPVLHQKLAPVMQRKTRADPEVAPYLPKVTERDVPVALDGPTRAAYKRIAADLAAELAAAQTTSTFDLAAYYAGAADGDLAAKGKIMARMQALAMLLCHPAVLADSAAQYAGGIAGSRYAADIVAAGALSEVTSSAKLDALIAEVAKILAWPDAKVVIFCTWRAMGPIIEAALAPARCVAYHGGMSAPAKAVAVERFTHEVGVRVMVCSHAAAYGTNLFAASHLINYDVAAQAGRADQINARHVRASSRHQRVYILNLVTAGTIEERERARLAFKRSVGSAVVDGRGADARGRIDNEVASLGAYLAATA